MTADEGSSPKLTPQVWKLRENRKLAASVIRTQPLQLTYDDLDLLFTLSCEPLSTSHRSAR